MNKKIGKALKTDKKNQKITKPQKNKKLQKTKNAPPPFIFPCTYYYFILCMYIFLTLPGQVLTVSLSALLPCTAFIPCKIPLPVGYIRKKRISAKKANPQK